MSDSPRVTVSDEQIAEALEPFASWPTRPQQEALAALVAAHSDARVEVSRVKRTEEIDWLCVKWTERYSSFTSNGALLDGQGEVVVPRLPEVLSVSVARETVQTLLGAEIMAGHMAALREKAQGRAEDEASGYVVDSELSRDVGAALQGLLDWRAQAVEALATLERDLTPFRPADAEVVRDLLSQVPTP